jgi:hypothetical protein
MSLARFAFQACSFIRLRSRVSSSRYGEMSHRSGVLSAVARSAEVEAAEEHNHSDISPLNRIAGLV